MGEEEWNRSQSILNILTDLLSLLKVTSKMSAHSYIIRHPEHDKIKMHMAESEKSFKLSVQETLKDRDFSPNCNHINLKPVKEAAIRF